MSDDTPPALYVIRYCPECRSPIPKGYETGRGICRSCEMKWVHRPARYDGREKGGKS